MEIFQSRYKKTLKYLDRFVFVALLGLLISIVYTSSSANIRTDSIDYYAILQRVVDTNAKPIIRNLHFVEQRSPGYPLIATIPYYLTTFFLEPFVETEQVTPLLPDTQTTILPPPETEQMSIPMQPLLFRKIFFKDFYFEPEQSWFEWKIISSLLFTSYFMLLMGITFIIKTLFLENKEISGVSLIMLTTFTSTVLMQNIINMSAYATLTAVGISSLFCWALVKSFLKPNFLTQFLSGLFLGLLVLTRLETIVIFGAIFVYLAFVPNKVFLRNFVIGAVIPLGILGVYNYFLFGTVFHLGILRGDINQISFDWGYISASILNPQSGIIMWSPLIVLGVIGLFLSNNTYLKALGISSLVLIGLVLVRIPCVYQLCIPVSERIP